MVEYLFQIYIDSIFLNSTVKLLARVQSHHRRCQRPNDYTVDRSRRDLIVAPINDLHVLVL